MTLPADAARPTVPSDPTDLADLADLADLLRFAEDLARRAGRQVRDAALDRSDAVTKSSASDWLTPVDGATEDLIRAELTAAYPDHAIVGEERPTRGDTAEAQIVWHVDPIDGTTNYLYGLGNVSVSIGAIDADGPAVGVVHDVYRDQTIGAARGLGVRVDGSPAVGADDGVTSLAGRVLLTEWSGHQTWPGMDETLGWVRDQQGTVRILGSCALSLAHAGLGRSAATLIAGRYHSWDVAAGVLIATEGGLELYDTHGPADGLPPHGLLVAPPGVVADVWTTWRRAAERAGA
ncbi:inositol monophosphatase family protein [Beutenbergia cavernae]|uniref:inositol monophosphatase family protein n=1 Tax=Beutenbergia cavernae TaxID=84757 RepID=UPI0016517271|nr:inositol monophosphatase family protein [Beutenbergia cavernae]